MANKCSNIKNTSSSNQPPSGEVKDSVSDKPFDFPTFDFLGRYCPHIPQESTPKPNYTSSPQNPYPNPYSSLN